MQPVPLSVSSDEDLYIRTLSRWTALAFDSLPEALDRVRETCELSIAAGRPERAAILAAQAVQWSISDFASLADLREWGAWLTAAPRELPKLEPHAALILCAGTIAAHQSLDAFDPVVRAALLPLDDCLDHYRARVLGGASTELDPNVLVATAEHPASWWSNTGNRAAIDELSLVVHRALDDTRLAPRIAARWLFWLGTIMMQNDQRASADTLWERARSVQPRWAWLDFHLHRVAARPLLEDRQLDAAAAHLDALTPVLNAARPLDLGDYHHLQGWLALLKDEPLRAAQHYRLALDAAERAALPPHMAAIYENGLAQSLLAQGQVDDAIAVYRKMHFVPGPKGDALRAAGLALLLAIKARRAHAADYAIHLARGLAAARELGLLRFLRALPRLAAQLCADALDLGIEPDFVRQVVTARGLAPPADAGESWCWPVKLYGLRPFAVVVDGTALAFGGKAPAKPLQLLRLLVAHGGEPVAVSMVMDRLWPDMDAAGARRALDVTLNRLRTLLLHSDCLLLSDGRLAFDLGKVWLDTQALDRLLHEIGSAAADGSARQRTFERIARLVRQPLFSGDSDYWIAGLRDRWQRRIALGVEMLMREAEHAGEPGEAVRMRQWLALQVGG